MTSAEPNPSDAVRGPERIGLVLVHGIGEQRRFQHLDGQLRDLIRALHGLQLLGRIDRVSVDISPGATAAFEAEQDTWNAGPGASVSVVVEHALNGTREETRLLVHEVWWADVNEPYSLAKQFRFWLWGLAVWSHPGKQETTLGTADMVEPPVVPGQQALWDRCRLFMIGVFFTLVGYSIGTFTFLANRLLNWHTPDVLRVLANYISSVKLYNQRRRFGPGLFWLRDEFLDSVGEPPRVSVRRRMIRTIADVAGNDYDRWYVLAHSQGSVVAFNGLMETSYAWPGYLNEERWVRLCGKGLAGPGDPNMSPPSGTIMPRRPGWAQATDIAYRRLIFARFHGFLTYGSPLEKFAGIWPALVPISREVTFAEGIPWLNIYDPVDPVSGRLLAFQKQAVACCPRPQDLGYAASWWLLLAHLKYLTRRNDGADLATAAVEWFLTDTTAAFSRRNTGGWRLGTWFRPLGAAVAGSTAQERVRRAIAWASWLAASGILVMLGAIVLPMMLDAAGALIMVAGNEAVVLAPMLRAPAHGLITLARPVIQWVAGLGDTFCWRCALLVGVAAGLTAIAGIVARALPIFFQRDDDDIEQQEYRQRLCATAVKRRALGI
jgi:hypothetical protein